MYKLVVLCALSLILKPSFGKGNDSTCITADQFIEEFKYAEAYAALKNCYAAQSGNHKILLQLSKVSFQLGKTKEAVNWSEQILEEDSTNVSALYQYAQLNKQLNKPIKSLLAYQKILSLDTNNAYFYRKAADIAYDINELEYALYAYQRCLAINPDDYFARLGIIKIHDDLFQFAKAEELADSALKIYPNNSTFWTIKAQIAYKMKNYESVYAAIVESSNLKGDTSLWDKKIKGVAAYHLEKYQECAILLEDVIQESTASEVVLYYAGMANHKSGNKELGVKYLNMAIEEGTSANLSSYYTHLGVVFDEEANFKDAIKAYQEAYRISKDRTILYHLARNYDRYYKDKRTAMLYYEKFLMDSDSSSRIFEEYSRHRLSELKKNLHFSIDTLN